MTRAQRHRNGTWFWYGLGRNTADQIPGLTFEEIKAEVAAFLRSDEGVSAVMAIACTEPAL